MLLPGWLGHGDNGNDGDSKTAQVCFFEHIDFVGQGLCIGEGAYNLHPDWNDRVSSVQIRGGARVELFADINLKGTRLSANADLDNLLEYEFNDLLSSFCVSK